MSIYLFTHCTKTEQRAMTIGYLLNITLVQISLPGKIKIKFR